MKNYIIIAGCNQTPFDNWYQSVKTELELKGFNVVVPYFPQGVYANYKTWEQVLKSYFKVGLINKNTTLVCHDLGCVFATRFIVKNRISVGGVVAVSPYNQMLGLEQDDLCKTFICKNEILSKVEKFVKFYHCIYSNNNPCVSEEVNDKFCNLTNAKTHEIEGGGNFTAKEGYTNFAELVTLIDNINEIV